jgi:flagellar export protein FliJ
MKKFRFQFDAVLKVRKSREQDALSALGAAQRAYQLELARKQDLEMRLAASLGRREELGRDTTPVLAFQIEQAFINGTKQRIIQADQAILRASRGVERALRAYLAARRQTRMIEMLEEKAYSEYRKEAARRERKDLDELMVMRARLADQSPNALEPHQEESA